MFVVVVVNVVVDVDLVFVVQRSPYMRYKFEMVDTLITVVDYLNEV